MTALSIPNSGRNSFSVISATAVSYDSGDGKGPQVYEGVTDIQYADGTHKTCVQIINDAGGQSYSVNELKGCVKVQAYDPDSAGRQVWLAYSSNSKQTAKNSVGQVSGGVSVDMFDFNGTGPRNPTDPTAYTNYILKMFDDVYGKGAAMANIANSSQRGFKINYGISESHSYVMTQVNNFQEESIPSPPTNIGVTIMHDAYLTGAFTNPAPIAGNYFVPILKFNLYRAAITSQGGFVYQRVPIDAKSIQFGLNHAWPSNAFPGAIMPGYLQTQAESQNDFTVQWGYAFTDNVLTQNLLEPLPSLDWDAPPPRKLKGLTEWRNGIMVAFADNQLYFCEPYRPFTFPQKYIRALPRDIVGVRVDENALVVLTKAEPYIFTGSHPTNVTYEKLQGVQAGIPPRALPGGYVNPTRAMVRTPKGVIYASKEGAVIVHAGRAVPFWDNLFTREEWNQRYGSVFGLMRMGYYDGKVVVYFDGDPTAGFIVDINSTDPRMVEYQTGNTQVADFVLPLTDSMYAVNYDGTTNTISRFADEGQKRVTGTYWTRDVVVPTPVNFGCLQVVGLGNVTASVYADGVDVADLFFALPQAVAGQVTQRLPAGFKARRWSVLFTLDGASNPLGAAVSEAYLAETRLELMKV